MPPVLFLAVVGAGAYAGFKFFSKLVEVAQTSGREEQERVRRERAARQAARETRDLGELEFDAASGVYRPKDRG